MVVLLFYGHCVLLCGSFETFVTFSHNFEIVLNYIVFILIFLVCLCFDAVCTEFAAFCSFLGEFCFSPICEHLIFFVLYCITVDISDNLLWVFLFWCCCGVLDEMLALWENLFLLLSIFFVIILHVSYFGGLLCSFWVDVDPFVVILYHILILHALFCVFLGPFFITLWTFL